MQALLAYGRGEVAHNVALGVPAVERQRRAGIGRGAGPQRKSFMMLAGEHDVPGARIAEDSSPFVGVPFLRLAVEDGSEVVVAEIGAEMFAMIRLGRRAWDPHHVQIPLCVGIVLDVINVAEVVFGMRERSPAGDRIKSVMNKDAKLGARIPLRQRMTVERLDRGLILGGRIGRGPS